MTALTCAAARQRLPAYYDRELPVAEQIAMTAHLESCEACGDALADFRLIGNLMRTAAPGRATLSSEENAGFRASIVNRVKAERDQSLVARVRGMFDDLHLVYAGLGAAVATAACVVIMLSMMRFATDERPDSLAAMVTILATPGSNANAAAIDPVSHARWSARFSAANESAEEDAVFALASVITREGRFARIDKLHGQGRASAVAGDNDAKVIEGLLDAVSRARFAPGPAEGAPSAANMVWLIAHTTVRASNSATTTVDLPLPASKKRVALHARTPLALV